MKRSFCVPVNCSAGGVVAAHAVDAAGWGGGGGAEEEAGIGGGVRVEAGDGAGEELAPVGHAADDIATDVVGVVGFHLEAVVGVGSEDGVAEAGGEAFDLGFDAGAHVEGAAVGDVAVGPEGVLAGGGAGGVAEGLLGDEDEGVVAVASFAGVVFRSADFVEGAADMDGAGFSAIGVGPGDGFRERVVDFEDAGAMAVAFEAAAVGRGEGVAGDLGEVFGGGVEEDGAAGGEVGEGVDAPVGDEFAAVVFEDAGEGGGDGLGAAFGDGPADCVGAELQHEGDGGSEGGFEGKDAVGGVAGEEGAGFGGTEGEAGEEAGGGEGTEAEGGHLEGVGGELEGREDVAVEGGGVLNEGIEEEVVGGAIEAEGFGGLVEGAVEDSGVAVFEGMGEGEVRVDPFEAVSA